MVKEAKCVQETTVYIQQKKMHLMTFIMHAYMKGKYYKPVRKHTFRRVCCSDLVLFLLGISLFF